MADIFLSYGNQDIGRIKILVEVLEQEGWSVWWDYKIRIGKEFDQVIEEEISKAKCIVVLWSNESVQSDWVKSEAEEGKRRKILAPALIDNVTIPLGFRRIEAARLYDWKGDLYHPELRLLLIAIAEIIGQPPPPAPPPSAPPATKNLTTLAVICVGLVTLLVGGIFIYKYLFPPTILEKVEGDGQVIPAGGWKSFVVKAVYAQGQPVVGAKVAWQTPECGSQVYIGETNKDGITSATNMCNVLPPGVRTQTAIIVEKEAPIGFTSVDKVAPIGESVQFTFQQQ